jgi:hypothetical protein
LNSCALGGVARRRLEQLPKEGQMKTLSTISYLKPAVDPRKQ